MAKLMAINYDEYGSYCQLQSGWINASNPAYTCDQIFSGNYVTQARAVCNDIYNKAFDLWAPTGAYRIYANTSVGCGTSYSFMIALNNGKWYCIGSSGRKGEYAYYGDPPYSNPGCYGNP